jgi:hypothetical protein
MGTSLEKFQQFLSENGKYPSSGSSDPPEKTLGNWVFNQRQNKSKMSADKKIRLDKIGFIWEIDTWPDKLQDLLQWLSKNDDKYPSQHCKDAREKALASWILHQRANKNKMSSDRKARLDEIGFIWEMVDTWPDKFQDLVQWLSKNDGKYPSYSSKDSKEKTLHYWVCNQRTNKNKMPVDRKVKLDKIGFIWEIDTWSNKLQDLLQWLSKNDGKYPFSNSIDPTERTLRYWVLHQRERKNKMSLDRKAKLDKMGFIWKIDTWSDKLQDLFQWLSKNDDKYPSSTSKNSEEKVLGCWVSEQRRFKNKMSADRKSKLDDILFQWELVDSWSEKLQDLVQWLSKYDDKYPSSGSKNPVEKTLGTWVLTQRNKKNKMSADRKSKLDHMGFIWSIRKTNSNVSLFLNQSTLPFCIDEELSKKRAQKSNEEKDVTKISDSVQIISDAEYLETKSQNSSLNRSIELINPVVAINKRKTDNNDDNSEKKPRTLLSQLQVEKNKIAYKQQILEEAERLFALESPTGDEKLQLEAFKRQFGFVDDTYNETNHTETHMAWKHCMNMVFTELVSEFTHIRDKILYLDGNQQHTTTALRSRFGNTRKLYVANWSKETCDNLKVSDTIDEIQHGPLKNILDGYWYNELFAAAYLDLCSGSASTIAEVLKSLLHSGHETKIVGFTMTQRDPEGYNQVERLDRLESDLRCLCAKITRVADFPKFKDQIWIEGGVVTRFYVIG